MADYSIPHVSYLIDGCTVPWSELPLFSGYYDCSMEARRKISPKHSHYIFWIREQTEPNPDEECDVSYVLTITTVDND
jgi:hypothetical protein